MRFVIGLGLLASVCLGCGSGDGDIPKDQSPQRPLGSGPGKIQGMADANRIAEQAKAKAR